MAFWTGLWLRTRDVTSAATSFSVLTESSTARLLLRFLETAGGLADPEALLAAGAVGTRVAALTIVAEGDIARPAIGLLAIASRRITLGCRGTILGRATEIAGAVLSRTTEIRWPCLRLLCPYASLLSQIPLCCAAEILVSVLRLIARLIELRRLRGARSIVVEVIRPVLVVVIRAVVIVRAIVGRVVRINAIVVVRAVVVVVAIDKGVGVGDVDVSVIDDRGVVPSASPRVIAPSAAGPAVDRCSHSNSKAE